MGRFGDGVKLFTEGLQLEYGVDIV